MFAAILSAASRALFAATFSSAPCPCSQVYKQKLYGPKHVWFIIGWYADNWYAQPDPHVNCTAAQMREALEGHFTTEGLMLNQDNVPTISGMVSGAWGGWIR